MVKKCPGVDSRFIRVEIHRCPQCGYQVEIFSDELRRRCPRCKTEVFRDKTPSCIEWCAYARQCIGEEKWQELKQYLEKKPEKVDFREKILGEMTRYFTPDIKRIQHAEKVLYFAEKIMESEGGDRNVVIPAAILHDIGIKECERKYNSTNGQLQEKEGPPIARRILESLGIKEEVIEEVCQIIASHHSPGELDTLNFKIIWDADWLVNLREEFGGDRKKLEKAIDRIFLTPTGKKLARDIYL